MAGFLANDFYLYDPTDQSKQLRFDTSSVNTSDIATLKVPNWSGIALIAMADLANSFTNTNTFSGLNVFQPGSNILTPIKIAQHTASQSFPLLRVTQSDLATDLLVINKNGNLEDTTFAICDGGDATKRVFFQCSGITTATDRTLTVPDADGTIALTSAIPTGGLAAGTYTPTRSAEANLDANVTMTEAQYLRVGNTVTVSGRFTADPTLTATTTSFEMTLPVASNLGAAEDVAGVAFCGNIAAQGAEVIGVAANDTAKVQWKASDITSQTWSYTFTYQVI